MNKIDMDGFTLVRSKRKQNKLKNGQSQAQAMSLNECRLDELRVKRLENTINTLKYQLLYEDDTNYWKNLCILLKNLIESTIINNCKHRKLNIRCYGLGSLDHNYAARYQFALLLIINDYFKDLIHSIVLYDPIFNANDKYLINKVFYFNLLSKNDECKFNVLNDLKCSNVATLFYMPHCCKSLYNNLLYSNWSIDALNNVYLFSNSFKLIYEFTLDDCLNRNYKYLLECKQFMHEFTISCNALIFNDAFSDLSLIKFRPCLTKINGDPSTSSFNLKNLGIPLYDFDDEIILK